MDEVNNEMMKLKEQAIRDFKMDFSTRIDGVLSAIEEVRREVGECMEHDKSGEMRISDTKFQK